MGLDDTVELLGSSLLTFLTDKFKYYPVSVSSSQNKDTFSFKFSRTDYSVKIVNSGDYLSVNLEVEPMGDSESIFEGIKNQKLEESTYLKFEPMQFKSPQINFSCKLEKIPDSSEDSVFVCKEIWSYMIQRFMKHIDAAQVKSNRE